MNIDINKLNYSFRKKPLLVGGKAMEYYGLRKSGKDIDFVADEKDVLALIRQYKNRVKYLYTDLGVCPFEFEIWRSIQLFTYDDLIENAIENKYYFVVSLEKLLLMKSLVTKEVKNKKDVVLITQKITEIQTTKYYQEKHRVDELIAGIKNIVYIEKTGPGNI